MGWWTDPKTPPWRGGAEDCCSQLRSRREDRDLRSNHTIDSLALQNGQRGHRWLFDYIEQMFYCQTRGRVDPSGIPC